MEVSKGRHKLILFGWLTAFLLMVSCGDDDIDGVRCSKWDREYLGSKITVYETEREWEGDENTLTCQDVLDVYRNAIDVMQQFVDQDCIPLSYEFSVQISIDDWEYALETFNCQLSET